MQANKIISVRSVSGKNFKQMCLALSAFKGATAMRVGGVWEIRYI